MKTLFVIGILLLILGCSAPGGGTGQTGYLQGHITIGPLCPVEKNPPDPNCEPTEATYKAYPFAVYKIPGSGEAPQNYAAKITEFAGDKDGNYKVELPAGSYRVRQESGLSKFSEDVQIKAGETTELNIDIDTGIR